MHFKMLFYKLHCPSVWPIVVSSIVLFYFSVLKRGRANRDQKGTHGTQRAHSFHKMQTFPHLTKNPRKMSGLRGLFFFCENPICQVDKQLYAIGTIEYPAKSGHILSKWRFFLNRLSPILFVFYIFFQGFQLNELNNIVSSKDIKI